MQTSIPHIMTSVSLDGSMIGRGPALVMKKLREKKIRLILIRIEIGEDDDI